jgi:hypothetical protein
LKPGGTSVIVLPQMSEEEWLASLPAGVADEIKIRLDAVF